MKGSSSVPLRLKNSKGFLKIDGVSEWHQFGYPGWCPGGNGLAVDKLVLRTRFNLPRARRQLFARPRLAARLSRLWDYPLTVVQAGPGYGKSTALVALLAGKQQSCFWYSLSEEDVDFYRRRVQWDSLPRWRAKGEVLELTQEDLAFNQEEIASFFQDYYGFGLTGEQLEILLRRTEGWIIALEMAWQALQSGATLARMWDEPPASLRALFEYLAQEVLAKQEPRVQRFLLATA